MSWRGLGVAPDGTHHLAAGAPAYHERFDEVLEFRAPGLAPVRRRGEAWHISGDGSAAYQRRFERTFGLYEGLAAVAGPDGWHHIWPDGRDCYERRYDWCGNFQGGRCAVRSAGGDYLHITAGGDPAYGERWRYAGDYRAGTAVVQSTDGLSTHVDLSGQLDHGRWFVDLDVFHKGFARARDGFGWMHVDRRGLPAYDRRFAAIEPFYNGQARVERFDGGLEVIDERGRTRVELRPTPHSEPLQGRVLVRTAWGRVQLVEPEAGAPFVSKWTRGSNDREVEALLALRGLRGVPALLARHRFDMNDRLDLGLCPGDPVGQPRALRRRPPQDSLRVTVEVLQTCAAMHAAGWIHTDIHPGNVLDGEPVTLLDFACAVRASYARPWQGDINWGVWEYVPPEQLTDHGRLDPAADVYSAAALCVAMSSGAAPFRVPLRQSLESGGWPAVRSAFVDARRSQVDWGLAGPIAEALAPALSMDPAGRPTAHRLAEDLADVQRTIQ